MILDQVGVEESDQPAVVADEREYGEGLNGPNIDGVVGFDAKQGVATTLGHSPVGRSTSITLEGAPRLNLRVGPFRFRVHAFIEAQNLRAVKG